MTNQHINDLVAHHVMGWKLVAGQEKFWHDADGTIARTRLPYANMMPNERPWNPLTDFNHAFEVVEKMREKHGMTYIEFAQYVPRDEKTWEAIGPARWMVSISTDPKDEQNRFGLENAPSIQRAICLACLKALGVEAPDA